MMRQLEKLEEVRSGQSDRVLRASTAEMGDAPNSHRQIAGVLHPLPLRKDRSGSHHPALPDCVCGTESPMIFLGDETMLASPISTASAKVGSSKRLNARCPITFEIDNSRRYCHVVTALMGRKGLPKMLVSLGAKRHHIHLCYAESKKLVFLASMHESLAELPTKVPQCVQHKCQQG